MAVICADMPQELRASLERAVIIAMGAPSNPDHFVLRDVDSSRDKKPFSAVHFSYYARSATKVCFQLSESHTVQRLG